MLISKDDYERCLRGFTVTDCAVRSRSIFYLVAVSEDPSGDEPIADAERSTRVLTCALESAPEKRWGLMSYKGMDRLRAGVALTPKEQFVGVDKDAQVVVFGSGAKEIEKEVPGGRQGPVRGGVRKTRTLNGLLHVSTGYRGLGRRDGRNQWTSLCSSLTFEPDPNEGSGPYGFEDFDAFNAHDYYCVGGKGDVWHFDGEKWDQIEFPSNMVLETVCCAGDGWVYISGIGGYVWKGRRDEWQLIHEDRMVLPFKDMVWFKDRVYCTSDYGLWEIAGDKVRESPIPPEIKICSGNLSTADGVMLLAGVFGASYYDGSDWKNIFNTAAFSPTTL
ncbi:hypothetical protein [Hyalangium versicolor]|uniref:hypothetical protein n=1 Tax=Hyalangium versicolor TaxID=2861190 RepID=UPI001CCC00B3|nr:hypothetical protein [Hyalangium versicolor]